MTLVLDIPPDLQQQLVGEAKREGLALEDYALRLLASRGAGSLPQNGPELVDYWQRTGVIGSRPDIDDPAGFANELRRQAETRTRE